MKHSSYPWLFRGSATGVALALGSLFAIACSATDPPAREQLPIAGGTQDLSHESVFLLVQETQNSGGLCTATLIAPNLLLTARHCVSPGTGDDHVLCGDSVLGDPYPASAFIATNDPAPSRDSQLFRAAEVRVPGVGVDTCGYDVALIILKQNVPTSVSTPAVPRIDREVHPGESYTAVGYGVNESGNPNHSRMQLEGLSVECEPGTCGDGIESTEFLGETGICPGDSGGPALDDSGKIVGVVSRGGPGCSTPVYSTVTAWQEFLVQTAQQAAELGGYEPPFWVTTGSSDPPVLTGEGGAGGTGAGGAPAATGASLGEACESTSACSDGLVCYAEPGSARGVCASVCNATSECGDGQECTRAGTVSVCAMPSGSGDESASCTVSSAPRSASGWALAAVGALVFAWRRARRFRAE